ncbi:hypothetical protein NAC44_08600 [Allorhizobium sp. BGMRC 0089]|uniref:DUF6622 family protein n=1 Tax=Allorhizobium sonneratiae TaxID=2934936 RepID=UPI002033DE3E|nr:DUF6622 family protein [Allorhizobium sonneratiae]MCM2292388.1 hypothetical protein [Allorhizobium sonneratiae]
MQFVLAVLSNTPTWVWVLFAYLILRGIKALSPRAQSLKRMFLMPVIFLVWSLIIMHADFGMSEVAFTSFFILLLVGLPFGANLVRPLPSSYRDSETGLIHRPGSPITLILVLISISFKYVMSVAIALSPTLDANTAFLLVYGGVSGLVDGIFWGMSGFQVSQALSGRAAPSAR